jgi:hypothetical protein
VAAKCCRTRCEDYSQEPVAAFTNIVELQLLILIFIFFSVWFSARFLTDDLMIGVQLFVV